jgi:hypothetical protein
MAIRQRRRATLRYMEMHEVASNPSGLVTSRVAGWVTRVPRHQLRLVAMALGHGQRADSTLAESVLTERLAQYSGLGEYPTLSEVPAGLIPEPAGVLVELAPEARAA